MSLNATIGINASPNEAKQNEESVLMSVCVIPTALATVPSTASDRIAVRFNHDMIMLYVVPSDPSVHFFVVWITIGRINSIDDVELNIFLAIA